METVAIETPLACATSRNVTADFLALRRRILILASSTMI
jgi:hypothetical protein